MDLDTEPPFAGTVEVQRLTGLTLRQLKAAAKLPADHPDYLAPYTVVPGGPRGRWRYSRADVNAWLERDRTGAPQPEPAR